MPDLVDHLVLVDDGSTDGTSQAARAVGDPRLEILRHERPHGVGASIAEGYRRARELGSAAAVVLAGDGQMDPADIPRLLAPILDDRADYVKGNRLSWPDGWRAFPKARLIGAHVLGALTTLACGFPVQDPQCGYTAIGPRALTNIDWSELWPSYGYPNDLLIRLSRAGLRVVEVPVRPIYADEVSKLRVHHLPPIANLLGRAIIDRARRRRSSPPVEARRSGSRTIAPSPALGADAPARPPAPAGR